jgi:hypothetical protein
VGPVQLGQGCAGEQTPALLKPQLRMTQLRKPQAAPEPCKPHSQRHDREGPSARDRFYQFYSDKVAQSRRPPPRETRLLCAATMESIHGRTSSPTGP